MMTPRACTLARKTGETDVALTLQIDGKGTYRIDTGCGFLNHMLELFARHGRFDLDIACTGDTHVDYHHTTEDVAITLGQAFHRALGDKGGIRRYGSFLLPMDEALIEAAVDVSGRGGLYATLNLPSQRVGDFDTELCREFWSAFAREGGMTLHLRQLAGENSHHIIEAVFKAMARALDHATQIDPALEGQIPSTKGVL